MRAQAVAAREAQARRFDGTGRVVNARMTTRDIKKHCVLTEDAESLLSRAMQDLSLSARAYTKVLKVVRGIADLDPADRISVEHFSEAIQYRSLDRNLWA